MIVYKAQMDALQAYISATVRVMTDEPGAHATNARLYVDAKARLEREFGQPLPTDYPDLLSPAPGLPDVL